MTDKSDIMKAAEISKQILATNFTFEKTKLMHEALIAAAKLLKQVEWQPIEKDYIDAEVYLCYFPENKGVEKYKAHGLLSVAKTKGATHYMIPQPPVIIEKEGV